MFRQRNFYFTKMFRQRNFHFSKMFHQRKFLPILYDLAEVVKNVPLASRPRRGQIFCICRFIFLDFILTLNIKCQQLKASNPFNLCNGFYGQVFCSLEYS